MSERLSKDNCNEKSLIFKIVYIVLVIIAAIVVGVMYRPKLDFPQLSQYNIYPLNSNQMSSFLGVIFVTVNK